MALPATLLLSLLFSMVPLFHARFEFSPQHMDTTLSFTAPSYRVNENNGPAQPVLVLSDPIDCCSTISVWVDIEEATAKEGEDYMVKSPVQVLIPGGHTRATFDVRMVDNVILEDSEKFIVSIDPLSLPYGVVLGDHATADVIIMDNDDATVSFETRQYEVEEGDRSVELTLSLSQPVPFNTSLELHAIDDTTTSRCDYDPGPHNVLISTDMTTFTYNIIISDDDVYEINEELSVNIASSNHSQIKISPTSRTARVTILDDEEPIDVSFSQKEFNVSERHGVVSPVIMLSRPTPCCVNLYVKVEDITADRGDDYGDTNTMRYLVTFPAGTNCSSFDIPIINDTLSEDDESFSVTILEMSLPFGTRLGDSDMTEVVIVDNDNYLSFSDRAYRVNEDEGSQFCITLTFDKPALFDTTVEVIDHNDTTTEDDYIPGPYYVNITKGDMSAELCINITDDNELEDDETFNLTINRDSDPEIILVDAGQAMVTILDDEYLFCFVEAVYAVSEGDGFAIVTLNFSRPLPRDIHVRFRYEDSVSAYGNDSESNHTESEIDYYAAYSWPNFDAVEEGSVNYTLNIPIVNDRRLEDNELIRLVAIRPELLPDGYTPCSADVIIIDDDDFRLEFDSRSYSVNTKNEPDIPVLRLHYPEIYNSTVIFPINVTIHEVNGTAIGGVDFERQNYFHSFEDKDDTYELILSPIDDNIVEADETYNLTFSFVTKHGRLIPGENHTTTITIYDDDVCFLSIVRENGKDTLDFSKQLATYVTVNITYDENKHNITTFTAEETKTKNRTPLPISPTKRISRIEVCVPAEFESRKDNVKAREGYKDLIFVNCA